MDDALIARAFDVSVTSRALHRPWFRPPSLEEQLVQWRHEDKAQPMEMWAAHDRDEVVGVGTMWLPMEDNTSIAWFDVAVDPAHRRRGAGTAIVSRLVERALAEGRSTVVTDTMVPEGALESHAHVRFLEGLEFHHSNTEVIRHLDLPVPDARLDELATQSAPHYDGAYRLETHVGGVPEALQDSWCAVSNQLAVDAPTGDIELEAESFTPARYQEHLEVERRMGRTRVSTVAVDRATGVVVALTDLMLPARATEVVWQSGTMVDRAHRGHRLGTAVKVQNVRHVQREHPERRWIATGNDETNRWMVEINLRLGYRVVELCPVFKRTLS